MLTAFISVAILVGQFWLAAAPVQARNTIEGRIVAAGNRPLDNIRVFLQDDGYAQIANTITDAAGRFRFSNLRSGNYYVTAEPVGTEYERQTQRVDAKPFNERRSGGGEIFRVEMVLSLRKTAGNTTGSGVGVNSVVFYQQVPEAAKKEFSRGVKSLEKSEFENATTSFKRAIEIFPDYYEALETLGTEYVKRRDYQSALPLLTHAIEVNKDGWRGFYSLGIAQHELKQRGEAVRSLRRAVELNPESPNTNMWLGITLAEDPDTRGEAIKAMEKVVKVAKQGVPEAYFYLGALYGKNGQYRQAADAFETFLHVAPQAGERDKIKKLIEDYRQKAKAQSK